MLDTSTLSNLLKSYKIAKSKNKLLSYWDFKNKYKRINRYADGTGDLTDEQKQIIQQHMRDMQRMSGRINNMFTVQDAISLTPLENINTVRDIGNSLQNNNYVEAALLGATMALPSALSKGVKRFIPELRYSFGSKYKVLKDKISNRNKVYQDATEQRNRIIEELYRNKDYWDRANSIKNQFGTDYSEVYKSILDQYENNYFNLPEVTITKLNKGRAKMQAKPSAIDNYIETGEPASYGDFMYMIDSDMNNIDYPVTRHELSHYADFNIAKNSNVDANNEMLNSLKGDLSTNDNPMYPALTDYFKTGSEQKSYMNMLRQYMYDTKQINDLGKKVSSKEIRRALDKLPESMNSVKAAYTQFKSPKLYTKWFNKIPLLTPIFPILMYQENNKEETKQ